jgi:hypothetical protein
MSKWAAHISSAIAGAVQDGGLTTAAACARAHVSLPAAVLAVWHWPPGTCTPPLPPAPKQSEFALAKLQWQFGAQAGLTANANKYGPGGTVVPFWVSAAKDLTKAITAGVADPAANRARRRRALAAGPPALCREHSSPGPTRSSS